AARPEGLIGQREQTFLSEAGSISWSMSLILAEPVPRHVHRGDKVVADEAGIVPGAAGDSDWGVPGM
ncbi:hypothetical protein, partial [Bifidobacterium asteroides]|uniref:hypothetical protein n=1 Tax=Bifidobacterium asteroides TaxID=1684 RepID=UPI001C5996D8